MEPSLTLSQAVRWAQQKLLAAGDAEAMLNAQWMLSHAAKVPRTRIWTHPHERLSPQQQQLFEHYVARREAMCPLGYILGEQAFMGRDFIVREGVLIPRQDTEILCEKALESLPEEGCALELCCGSGALAVTLALEKPKARVVASDLSPVCIQTTLENAAKHNVQARMQVIQSDLYAALPPMRFDVIVCNPPYIPVGEIAHLMPDVRDFEPHLALDGGEDGLGFYRRLALETPPYLGEGGVLCMELGHDQSDAARHIFEHAGWSIDFYKDLSGIWRVAVARRG